MSDARKDGSTPFTWRVDEYGRTSCLSCQEPVGQPVWPWGCLCVEKDHLLPSPVHFAVLEAINGAWDQAREEALRYAGLAEG